MIGEKKDGGPAFPAWHPEVMNQPEAGMSVRDYFASKIAMGYVSSLDDGRLNYTDPSTIAEYAYTLADAMILERAK